MYQVIYQKDNKIEISLSGNLSAKEFKEVVHQLESLCAMYPKINVLFLTDELDRFPVSIILEEFDFYKKYKNNLERVAIVSNSKFQALLTKLFGNFSAAAVKSFTSDQVEDARTWIFPTNLP